MNKQEFINKLASDKDYTKKYAGECIDNVLETIIEVLESGEKLNFMGFGIFEAKLRAEKKGINPATKEPMIHPSYIAPTLSFSSVVKKRLN